MAEHDQGDVRARQIAAAIGALEYAGIVDPAPLAAQLVDAVNAAGGQTQDLGDGYHEADLRAGVWLWLDAAGIRVMPDRTVTLRWKTLGEPTEAEARGWNAAVEALRDPRRHVNWVAAGNPASYVGPQARGFAADYLEAVGPQKDQKRIEDAARREEHTDDH